MTEGRATGAEADAQAPPACGEPLPFTIGELARLTGVKAESIRYYEREGVLPEPERTGPGRYRRYGQSDVERLRFIRRARDLGFSLDEVREMLALAGHPEQPCDDVDRIARARLAQVEAKIEQLVALRAELRRVIAQCRGGTVIADCRILQAFRTGDGPASC